MNRALLGFLIRRYWWKQCLCAFPAVLVGSVVGVFFPAYQERQEVFRNFLPVVQRLFGDGVLDLFTVRGFFNIPFQHPLTLACFALVVALPALAFPAGERGRGTLDLLLAGALSRRDLVLTVAAFLVPGALLVALSPMAGSLLGATISGNSAELEVDRLLLISLNGVCLILWLGSACLLISVLSRDRATATARYLWIVLGGMLLQLVAQLWDGGAWLGWVTPFGYYRPAPIMVGQGRVVTDGSILVLTAGILVVLALLAEERSKSA